MALNVIAAFLPAAVFGLLFEKPIKKYPFGGEAWGLWPIVAAWFFGGAAILAVSWWQSSRQTKTHQSGPSLELADRGLVERDVGSLAAVLLEASRGYGRTR